MFRPYQITISASGFLVVILSTYLSANTIAVSIV
jgi:hypothetical protein